MAESVLKDLASASDATIEGLTPPSAKMVDFLHGNASTAQRNDIHHKLGFAPEDAAAGDHTHNGVNSPGLFTGLTFADITAGATGAQIAAAVNAINAALRLVGGS